MDDELELLMGELMSAQEQQTNPLPERTIAEIMVKLYHEGFKFYPTTDGNEYLTPEKLDQEIVALVSERGHINICIIPQILNVGLDTIDSRVTKILAAINYQNGKSEQLNNFSSQRFVRHNNLLLSEKYLKSVIENIRQTLLIEGKINLETIALENEFNMVYTEKLIKQHIVDLNAELHNNQLITTEYNQMKKVSLRGFLRAIGSPISFESIVKASGLTEDSRNVEKLLVELIVEKMVKGKYQNSYYVPDCFLKNQRQSVFEFFNSNGYIEFGMLQKQFLVNNPEEWLKKNIHDTKIEVIDDVCFKSEKLEQYALHLKEMLRVEGFVEISTVIPFAFEDEGIDRILSDYCEIKDYFLCDGYIYSSEWLERVKNEFKDKVFKSIFFSAQNSNEPKGKKKGAKKQSKVQFVSEAELVEKLFNEGLAEYSVAQNLAPDLLPILTKKLEDMKRKLEKQLSGNRGILNSNFLKYKSCKTIMRNEEGLMRMLNIIEKQNKKGSNSWRDPDFGPNESDAKGLFSVVYYDEVLPKGWPRLQEGLKWENWSPAPNPELQSELMLGCFFSELLSCLEHHNKYQLNKEKTVTTPMQIPQTIQSINSQEQGPFVFGFYRTVDDRRFVLVDSLVPTLDDKFIGLSGLIGMAEKAYAKFRYCYKGILNLAVKTVIFEMSGKHPEQYLFESSGKNSQELLSKVQEALKQERVVILIGEGESSKKIRWPEGEEQTHEFICLKPYLVRRTEEKDEKDRDCFSVINPLTVLNNNQGHKVPQELLPKLFKNVYVI